MSTDAAPARLTKLSRSVAGKRVIVTGAASGMGRATAHLFADEGARVAVVDIGAERVLAVVDEIRSVHGQDAVEGFVCDVGSHDELKALVAAVVAWGGTIDVLVNNAGISRQNSALQDEESYEANWAETLNVNLTAHFLAHPPVPPVPARGRRRRASGQHRLDRVDRHERRRGGGHRGEAPAWSA